MSQDGRSAERGVAQRMGWERRRTGTYYYRAKKLDGRVVKEYVGAGPLAELEANHDAERQSVRAAAAESRRAECACLATVDATVDASYEAVDTLLRASLVLAGYHRHQRGEWRRRRDD